MPNRLLDDWAVMMSLLESYNLNAIEGKSHKEIAELLGIKPDTSASQYHRAKAMLARLLSKRKKETQ